MDLVKKPQENYGNLVVVVFLVLKLCNAALIAWTIWQMLQVNPDRISIIESWKQFRNELYLIYLGLGLVIGFLVLIGRKTKFIQMIPLLVAYMITTTFSYAIAGFIVDILKILHLV